MTTHVADEILNRLARVLADADAAARRVAHAPAHAGYDEQVVVRMSAGLTDLSLLGDDGAVALLAVVGDCDAEENEPQYTCPECLGTGAPRRGAEAQPLGWGAECCDFCRGTGDGSLHRDVHPDRGMGYWNALTAVAATMGRFAALARRTAGEIAASDEEELAGLLAEEFDNWLERLTPRVRRAILRAVPRERWDRAHYADPEDCCTADGCERLGTVFVERPDHWFDDLLCEKHATERQDELADEACADEMIRRFETAEKACAEETFDEEVRRLTESDPRLSVEDAQYLVKVRRLHGYKTHVWI